LIVSRKFAGLGGKSRKELIGKTLPVEVQRATEAPFEANCGRGLSAKCPTAWASRNVRRVDFNVIRQRQQFLVQRVI
jgi:hypothetical protein